MTRTALPVLLREAAEQAPDELCLHIVEGRSWTYGEIEQRVRAWTRVFRSAGVLPGARVMTMIPTSGDALAVWIALGWIGAIEVPVNLDYDGVLLGRVIEYAEPGLAVIDRRFAEGFAAATSELECRPAILHVSDPDGGDSPAVSASPEEIVGAMDVEADDPASPRPEAITLMLFTSGTTGTPKGVMTTWAKLHAGCDVNPIPGRVISYSVSPLFHTTGREALYRAIARRSQIVMRERFSGTRFWDDISAYGCNAASLMASFMAYLAKLGLPEGIETSTLKYVSTGRVPDAFLPIARKLGLKFSTVFNMTEVSPPIVSDGWLDAPGESCGRMRPGYQCRVVDSDDREVPPGEVGELVVRADEPWVLMQGYWRRPEETLRAWRNLWFHTGDTFRRDAEGRFYFMDRQSDVIRRRGENISSRAIEEVVEQAPGVDTCVAVSVAADVWDEEVKVVVSPKEGAHIDPAQLHAWLASRLPRFMVPRYIEVASEIPRTPTRKPQKTGFREAGVTQATWDAEVGRS
jgi:crotonobetaine/carnitine-CoA ligase